MTKRLIIRVDVEDEETEGRVYDHAAEHIAQMDGVEDVTFTEVGNDICPKCREEIVSGQEVVDLENKVVAHVKCVIGVGVVDEDDELDEWIQRWAMDNGSAADMWMDSDMRPRLRLAVESPNVQVKSKQFDSYSEARKWRDKKLATGWKLLDDVDNIDSAEVILFKEV